MALTAFPLALFSKAPATWPRGAAPRLEPPAAPHRPGTSRGPTPRRNLPRPRETHQQVSQCQLLRAAPAFIPAMDLKGQNLSLAAIILKHLKLKDSYFRGLVFLNLHMLLLRTRQSHFKKIRRASFKWTSENIKDHLNF